MTTPKFKIGDIVRVSNHNEPHEVERAIVNIKKARTCSECGANVPESVTIEYSFVGYVGVLPEDMLSAPLEISAHFIYGVSKLGDAQNAMSNGGPA